MLNRPETWGSVSKNRLQIEHNETWNPEDCSDAKTPLGPERLCAGAGIRVFGIWLDGSGTTPDHWGADASMAPGTSSVAQVLVLQQY